MLQFVRSYWKTILTAILIAYLSLFKPAGDIQLPPIPFVDKWIHLLLYATLTAIALFETKKYNNVPHTVYVVVLASILYSGFLEVMQHYFPPRVSSWYDFIANILGCLLAYGVFKWYETKK